MRNWWGWKYRYGVALPTIGGFFGASMAYGNFWYSVGGGILVIVLSGRFMRRERLNEPR